MASGAAKADISPGPIDATRLRVDNHHGNVTVFGQATLTPHPPEPDGHIKLVIRYDSRSLWLWFNKYPTELCTLDLWFPTTGDEDDGGPLVWTRITAYRVRLESNHHDRHGGVFVATGWAEREPKTGEVLRFRHDRTSRANTTGEDSPAGGGAW